MSDALMEKVMAEVLKRVGEGGDSQQTRESKGSAVSSVFTEFVGTATGDTIGLVIANLDSSIHEKMGLDSKFRSIGVIGARTGAGPQLMAADDAVKATNTELILVELCRDTKGGAGHGCLIVFGAEEVSDARRAVEVTLNSLDKYFGDVYACDAGHLELQYSARASLALAKAFGAPVGKAFGLIVGAPAAVGVLMADYAVKSASVEVIGYSSPAHGSSFTNEVAIMVGGESGAVRAAVIAGREIGKKALAAMGPDPQPAGKPYI